jgi:hypothetical protein
MTGITEPARLLVDEDGLVRPITEGEILPTTALLRFERIPTDQIDLGTDEFLVRAQFCTRSNDAADPVPLTKTFLFTILPGELANAALRRIWAYHFFRTPLLPHVELRTGQKTLKGGEAVDSLVRRTDVLMIVLPGAQKVPTRLTNRTWDKLLYPLGDAD